MSRPGATSASIVKPEVARHFSEIFAGTTGRSFATASDSPLQEPRAQDDPVPQQRQVRRVEVIHLPDLGLERVQLHGAEQRVKHTIGDGPFQLDPVDAFQLVEIDGLHSASRASRAARSMSSADVAA